MPTTLKAPSERRLGASSGRQLQSARPTRRNSLILIKPEEIDELRLEAKHTIDMATFVDRNEIDSRYFEKPYYLLPDGDDADEGYVVLRDALAKSKKVAVGQLIMHGREHLAILIRSASRRRRCNVEELIALTGDYRVARAAFEEAVKRRPGRIVTLRRKTRLLATTESHRPSHNPAMMRVNRGGNAMDAKARAFVLMKLRPMLEAFKEAVVEERANGASDAKIEAMIEYALETNSKHLDPDVLKAMVVELREIARSTHQGPATVQ